MPNRLRAPIVPGIISLALLAAAMAGPGAGAARAAASPSAQGDASAPASLTVLTVNGDDEPVPGACYDLFVDEDGPTDFVAEQCDAYDGAADGTTAFAGIPSGDYVLVQLFVPAGYKTGKDRSLSIVAGEQAAYSFRTPRGGRAVTLALQDDNAQPLPGGCYSLYPAANGQPAPALKVACDFYDGADDGTATIAGLDNGAYDVILSSPPEGYTIPIGQSINIGADDRSLVFAVALGGETVSIASVDDSGDPVPGACHRLYAAAGDGGARSALVAAPCDRADGAADGTIAVIGLVPGAYVLAAPGPPAGDGTAGESSPASEPATPADIPFEVVAGEGAQIEVVSLSAENGTPAA